MTLSITAQVCSLPLARKLRELGVPQESFFEWVYADDFEPHVAMRDEYPMGLESCAAYTAAELGELLPERIVVGDQELGLEITRQGDEWECCYNHERAADCRYMKMERSLADALASLLAHLLESGLLTLPVARNHRDGSM